MPIQTGHNFLQTPGPTNIPERVLAAMMRPAIDMSDPVFGDLTRSCFDDLKRVFKTDGEMFVYASNGHGAWEAALVNVLSPGDRILVPESGHFSFNWAAMARSLGIEAVGLPMDWRRAINVDAVADALRADTGHTIKAVLMVHTDTATGITSNVPLVRKAIDDAGHPALFMVDTIAALATVDFRMDEWGVDVAVGATQKGLMQPPGLGINAANDKALQAHRNAGIKRNYWDWGHRMAEEYYAWFCGTIPEHLIFGLRAGLDMLLEEGLDNVFARHARMSEAVRLAVGVWSRLGAFEINATEPAEQSNSVTTILMDSKYDANRFRETCRDRFDVSLGGGLGQLRGKAFRIAHMGYLNEPMILGALAGVQTCLAYCDIPHDKGGVDAAIEFLSAK